MRLDLLGILKQQTIKSEILSKLGQFCPKKRKLLSQMRTYRTNLSITRLNKVRCKLNRDSKFLLETKVLLRLRRTIHASKARNNFNEAQLYLEFSLAQSSK